MVNYTWGAIACILIIVWGLLPHERTETKEEFDDIEFFDFWIDDE